MPTKTVRSVLERFERVATMRLPSHAELEELADFVGSDLKDAAEELLEAIDDFIGHVETLIDDDGDREDKREARDSLPEEARTIFEKLDAITYAVTVKPDSGIKL
jgi:DNA phosphorothioation-dependent restriction protein DptG